MTENTPNIQKVQSSITGLIVFTVLAEGAEFSWDVVKKTALVELTPKEEQIAKAKDLDLEKFLRVKQLLTDGCSYSKINKLTGIAKTTITRYRKDFCKSSEKMILETYKKPS
jgi:hypothetical protein